jgi:hypothetical protein
MIHYHQQKFAKGDTDVSNILLPGLGRAAPSSFDFEASISDHE